MKEKNQCFHCGIDIKKEEEILFNEKNFCCTGCKTIYEIFASNELTQVAANHRQFPVKIDFEFF
jgi:hypothetical protein